MYNNTAAGSQRPKTEPDLEWKALANDVTALFVALRADGVLMRNDNEFVTLPRHPTMKTQSGDRFVGTRGDDGMYKILHRELAERIISEVTQRVESPGENNNNRLYVHGTQGVGKSHSIYEAVCALMARRDTWRVVYVNDCKAWVGAKSAKLFLARHVAMAFDPEEERAIWDACIDAESEEAVLTLLFTTIPRYCASKGLKFACVFDQHNGLSRDKRACFPFLLLERQMCNEKSWKGIGALVISACANNEYQLQVLGKETFKRIDVYGGFSDGELKNWSQQHSMFVGDKDWDSVTALYGNLPLALGVMKREHLKRAGSATTLLDLLNACDSSMRAKMTQREMGHYSLIEGPEHKHIYQCMILDMLLAASGQAVEEHYVIGLHLMNRHLMYWDETARMFRPIHELARQIYVSQRYVSLQTVLDDTTVVKILTSSTVNHSVKSSMVKLYAIACAEEANQKRGQLVFTITSITGQKKWTVVFRPFLFEQFGTQSVPAGLDFTRSTVFKPKNSNYPGIDLLFLVISEDSKGKTTKELYAFQFTVGPIKNHTPPSDSLLDKWRTSSGATLYYVWATPPEAKQVTAVHGTHFHCNLADLKFADLLRYY